MDTVGNRLRHARERKVLTQAELATASGVGWLTILRIEHGQQQPRPSTIRKLAAALGVEPTWLLFGVTDAAG